MGGKRGLGEWKSPFHTPLCDNDKAQFSDVTQSVNGCKVEDWVGYLVFRWARRM